MQGAATIPTVSPMANAPTAPVLAVPKRLVNTAGTRTSKNPQRLKPSATITSARTIGTHGCWSTVPNMPPVKLAMSPNIEYVIAKPST